MIQENHKVPEIDNRDSHFKVIRETKNGNTAWVQFSIIYEEKPETFKLIKEEGSRKVSEIEMGEKCRFKKLRLLLLRRALKALIIS